jgi:glycogen debranching enzyme
VPISNANSNPANLANIDLVLNLRPDSSGQATIAWVLSAPKKNTTASQSPTAQLAQSYQEFIQNQKSLQAAAVTFYQNAASNVLDVQTPDPAVNQAIRWSEIALDQAWACNPDLGCGFVAGYGPSRIERRPQYAWFFAGDGLVAADGALSAGDYKRTREELEFILHYQDKKNGMIWHEMSQSAPMLDWVNKYPYMFVHVDITFQFLSFVHQYIQQSGDTDFLRQNWPAFQSAYHYASMLINAQTGLPQIPPDKEGGDEQTRLIDDLGLSTSWVDASAAYASMAGIMGDAAAANEAAAASQRARAKFQSFYWSDANQFWINGRTITGALFEEQRSGPSEAIDLHLFTPEDEVKVLNRIASPDFLTPWGIRSVAANSPGYKPTSYGQGSIWPVGTLPWAETFWSAHRPSIAFKIWSSQIPLTTLDSAGHIHEVFEGGQLRPQLESVPEQTWSSATFLSVTVHGLLGIEVDALNNQLTFAPYFPVDWPTLTLRHLTFGTHQLDLQLTRTANSITLNIDNPGPSFLLRYRPELPLGTHHIKASQNHVPIICTAQIFAQTEIGILARTIPTGTTEIFIQYSP